MFIKILLIMILIWLCFLIVILLGNYLRTEIQHYYYNQAPTIGTYTLHYQLMKKYLVLENNKTLLDLWCWTWSALRFFKKNYHLKQIDGIDNNYTAILWGRLLNRITHHKDIDLCYGDIQAKDISSYDYIYLFLLPKQLDNLQEWLLKNMKSDAIVICNTFAFSDRKPLEEYYDMRWSTTIRLYRK